MEQKIKLTLKDVLCLSEQEKKELTRKNLLRVLEELPKLAEQMPEIKRDFNMAKLGVYYKLKREDFNKCRTTGCILGNAARIFKNEFTEDLFNDFGKFSYYLFGLNFFPYLYYGKDYDYKTQWEYLFEPVWERTKFNKFEDALQRIENLIKHDLKYTKYDLSTNNIINYKIKNKHYGNTL